MRKMWRWLKKNRYYVSGIAFVLAVGLMVFIGANASDNSGEDVAMPTETVIPYIPPTDLPPSPTLPPYITPTTIPSGQGSPYPTLVWPNVPSATPAVPLLPTPTTDPLYASLFEKCDVNCDGVVNTSDIRDIFMSGLGFGPRHISLCGLAKVDTNGNGKIDLEESGDCFQIVYWRWQSITK